MVMCMSTTRLKASVVGRLGLTVFMSALVGAVSIAPAVAQTAPTATPTTSSAAPVTGPAVDVPAEYLIGPQDVLGINFWRDTDMTGDVTVRPDGRITLPLIGDLTAAGLTPDQLKSLIQKAASKLLEDPAITVVVRQINSRKVFITGQVATPGAKDLTGPLTVMQLIARAGGLNEYANKKNITIMRTEDGKPKVFTFNYNDVAKGKNLSSNILLRPGDTVVVP
jgi:polysaccharide biosynthesis/export protein